MSDISSILARYQELLSEVDTWFTHCSLAAGDQIACQRGCSACCRGLFDITLLDARLLREGFEQLSQDIQQTVTTAAQQSIAGIRNSWPDFDQPYLFNGYPEEEWDLVMPEEDETPCPLLGQDGLCLVYQYRPMTCRLNGIPMVDTSGEILFDEWCSLNFIDVDPLKMQELRFHFNDLFTQEQLLFREFTQRLFGKRFNELDTVIPSAVLIDFNNFRIPEQVWKQRTT
ncbi:Putative zinc-or iron-chelating domain-containing protein [Trichlorobacter thiogenes]|uniref:Putative zinc-or iron-chelating domain-containing protein n=1 Tax=Trichlorobacter thiogenes TaxID=115783 RepID=A0A1T4QZJ8_9BACT|nr:YkgJ family cysteine cluster protein [Trichlorobacter thiogenes]SKA09027.1 Putative zinc-or iron-chelating domain-containing protein [Trichlorobacter thiogenes]